MCSGLLRKIECSCGIPFMFMCLRVNVWFFRFIFPLVYCDCHFFFLFCYCWCCCCCCSSFGVLPRHKLLCIQSSCYAVASMHLHFQLFSLILRLYKTFEFYIRDSMFLFSITCFCVGTYTHAHTIENCTQELNAVKSFRDHSPQCK